jgi:hypothetical protein
MAGNALAQDSDPIRHYEVEIVLYKNTKVPKSKEYTLPISSPVKDHKSIDFSLPSGIEAAKELQYEIVPETELRLTDVARKMNRSSRYKVLKHLAWRQPGLKKSLAMPIWIKAGSRYGNEFISIDDKNELLKSNRIPNGANNQNSEESTQNNLNELGSTEKLASLTNSDAYGLYELEGEITVSLSRYLHVYTDLVLRKPRRSLDPETGSLSETAGSQKLLYRNLTDGRILDNHLLKEHRRMRSETLHYLDSPELSMLILITPYEIPAALQSTVSQTESVATKLIVTN